MAGSQSFVPDERNESILVYVNGGLMPRREASVSVFDSGFAQGDGIWESFRLQHDTLQFAERHIDRLMRGLRSVGINLAMTPDDVLDAVVKTVEANGMHDGVHVRLMITRGPRRTASQDPREAQSDPTVVIVPEYKIPDPSLMREGLRLSTSTFRCTRSDMLDPRLNTHSRLPLILALRQALQAGADEALMLDVDGFVSTCNATNFFFVAGGHVKTSTGRSCFHGITRANVIDLCQAHAIPYELGDFSLAEVHAADEAFVTGTFGGVTPVQSVDGNRFAGVPGPITQHVQELYSDLTESYLAGQKQHP